MQIQHLSILPYWLEILLLSFKSSLFIFFEDIVFKYVACHFIFLTVSLRSKNFKFYEFQLMKTSFYIVLFLYTIYEILTKVKVKNFIIFLFLKKLCSLSSYIFLWNILRHFLYGVSVEVSFLFWFLYMVPNCFSKFCWKHLQLEFLGNFVENQSFAWAFLDFVLFHFKMYIEYIYIFWHQKKESWFLWLHTTESWNQAV